MTYYLAKQFQQNQIFDLLAGNVFTRVVSLDMGRGWTRARLYTKYEEDWTETVLKLDDKENTRIPTRIIRGSSSPKKFPASGSGDCTASGGAGTDGCDGPPPSDCASAMICPMA